MIRIQDLAKFVLDFAVDFAVSLDRFGWQWVPIGESIQDQRLNLRDVKHRMDEPGCVRMSKMDGVVANTVDDPERS